MQTRKDAALRKIVIDGRLPIKTRRDALSEMEAPSRAFLVRLANDTGAPAKLRLDASRKLPGVEQRIVAEQARRREEPNDEARRREIDEVLQQAAQELGINLDDARGSKTVPETAEPVITEPQPAAPVPVDGASTDAGSRSQAHALQDCYQSEPPAVRSPDSDTKREEMLAQGRALAASVLVQYERFTRCPHNLQESKRLEYMQDQFLKWEREAVECDIPTRKEFPNPRLRPVIKIVVERSYISERRAHAQAMSIWKTADECDGPRAPFRLARKQYRSESGFWSGMPGGI